MKKVQITLWLLMATFLIPVLGSGSQLMAQAFLFEKNERLELTQITMSDAEIRGFDISLNAATLEDIRSKQTERFLLNSFDENVYDITIRRVIEHSNGSWSVSGFVNDHPLNSFTMSVTDGKVLTSISVISDHKFYEMRFSPDLDNHLYLEIDPHKRDRISCGVDHSMRVEPTKKQKDANHRPLEIQDGPATIDVMIVYTPAAKAWAENNGRGIDNIIAQSMTVAQNSVDNSEVEIIFRLVHTAEIDYEETGDSGVDLERLTASPDFNPFGEDAEGYMEEVHEWRDQYGADLVALFTETDDTGGIAWLGNDENGAPDWAFSITRIQQADGITHVHEMGHNMGSDHSRNQEDAAADESGGLFEYSTGWRWVGSDGRGYTSLMTYGEGDTEIELFSNPDINFLGTPTGSYEGEYAPADNARSLREIKHVISQYRDAVLEDSEITVSVDNISITTVQGQNTQASFEISNIGGGKLEYSIIETSGTNESRFDSDAQAISEPRIAAATKPGNVSEIQNASVKNTAESDMVRDDNQIFFEDFESYTDFAISFSPWKLIDGDGSTTYGIADVTYPNSGEAKAFMIFNPSETDPPVDGAWNPRPGNTKYAASFASQNPPNDDWMISPEITLMSGSEVSFWAKSYTDEYGLERFRVGVTTEADPDPEDFTIITDGDYVEAPTSWTQFNYDLSDYDNETVRIGIHTISNDAFVFMVDEFSVTGEGERLITFSPNQGSLDQDESQVVTVNVNSADLEAGTYNRVIRINNNDPTQSQVEIGFEVEVVENTDQVVLREPANEANNVSVPVVLKWFGTDADHYVLEINQTSGGNFSDTIDNITETEYAFNDAEAGESYSWRVAGVKDDDQQEWSSTFTFTTAAETSLEDIAGIPSELRLHQNYPNPFNPVTQIQYGLPESGTVKLEVFDNIGRRVAVLVDQNQTAGWHTEMFDASHLSSGMYIYRLQQGNFVRTQKMMLVK